METNTNSLVKQYLPEGHVYANSDLDMVLCPHYWDIGSMNQQMAAEVALLIITVSDPFCASGLHTSVFCGLGDSDSQREYFHQVTHQQCH